jgi:hypothetical protein
MSHCDWPLWTFYDMLSFAASIPPEVFLYPASWLHRVPSQESAIALTALSGAAHRAVIWC